MKRVWPYGLLAVVLILAACQNLPPPLHQNSSLPGGTPASRIQLQGKTKSPKQLSASDPQPHGLSVNQAPKLTGKPAGAVVYSKDAEYIAQVKQEYEKQEGFAVKNTLGSFYTGDPAEISDLSISLSYGNQEPGMPSSGMVSPPYSSFGVSFAPDFSRINPPETDNHKYTWWANAGVTFSQQKSDSGEFTWKGQTLPWSMSFTQSMTIFNYFTSTDGLNYDVLLNPAYLSTQRDGLSVSYSNSKEVDTVPVEPSLENYMCFATYQLEAGGFTPTGTVSLEPTSDLYVARAHVSLSFNGTAYADQRRPYYCYASGHNSGNTSVSGSASFTIPIAWNPQITCQKSYLDPSPYYYDQLSLVPQEFNVVGDTCSLCPSYQKRDATDPGLCVDACPPGETSTDHGRTCVPGQNPSPTPNPSSSPPGPSGSPPGPSASPPQQACTTTANGTSCLVVPPGVTIQYSANGNVSGLSGFPGSVSNENAQMPFGANAINRQAIYQDQCQATMTPEASCGQ